MTTIIEAPTDREGSEWAESPQSRYGDPEG